MARGEVVSLLAMLAASGCGRIGFALLGDGDGGAGDGGGGDGGTDAPIVMCNPSTPFGTPVLISELDQGTDEGTLVLLPDELTGYYWEGPIGTRDLRVVTRASVADAFTSAPVQGVNTTMFDELDPAISSDGSVLVFRRSAPGDDLFVATRITASSFDPPVAIASLNTTNVESQAFMPIGRDELYFQSTRTGMGEIFVAPRTGTTFGAVTQLVSVASGFDDGTPVVTRDGLTLYFRSDRVEAFGGHNIYVATRTSTTDAFGGVMLVANVNSNADDGPSWISPDLCRLYLSSRRVGDNDIYVASRAP